MVKLRDLSTLGQASHTCSARKSCCKQPRDIGSSRKQQRHSLTSTGFVPPCANIQPPKSASQVKALEKRWLGPDMSCIAVNPTVTHEHTCKGHTHLARIVHVIRLGRQALPLQMLHVVRPHVIQRLLNTTAVPHPPENDDGVWRHSSCTRVRSQESGVKSHLFRSAAAVTCTMLGTSEGKRRPPPHRTPAPYARCEVRLVVRKTCCVSRTHVKLERKHVNVVFKLGKQLEGAPVAFTSQKCVCAPATASAPRSRRPKRSCPSNLQRRRRRGH